MVCGILGGLELVGKIVSLYRHPVLDTGSQGLSKGDDIAIADRATLVRNDGNPPQPPLANDTQSFARQSLEKGGSVCNDETPLVP